MRSKKILIAASGSGGHLLPALYISEEIKKLFPDAIIEFCGSGRPLEEKLIGGRGYKINIIPIVGVSRRGLSGKLEFLAKLPYALFKTFCFMWRFKPDLVLGVGGYISVLPIIIGKLLNAKTLIHEAELHPGLANSYLAFFASLATIANSDTKFKSRIPKVYTGQPLNPNLFKLQYHFPTSIKKILVLGGSQGANQLDLAISELAQFLKEEGISLKHQSRPENVERLQTTYNRHQLDADVFSFSDEIPNFYHWADLIITRSGLNTVRELEVVEKPVVFVPLPKAPEQKQNSITFQESYLAEVVEESSTLSQDLKTAIQIIQTKILNFHPKPCLVLNGSQQIAKEIASLISTTKD